MNYNDNLSGNIKKVSLSYMVDVLLWIVMLEIQVVYQMNKLIFPQLRYAL